MALHDTEVRRLMAFGIAGLSAAWRIRSPPSSMPRCSPSATRRTASIVDFEIEGDFPKFGNDDDRVDRDRV